MHKFYLGLNFKKVGKIELKKANGKIITYRPQSGINRKKTPLNKYAKGSFCYFEIAPHWRDKAGLYIFMIKNEEKYIGECDDLFYRIYDYGHITPRKCHKDGQSTNCKINRVILKNANNGSVDLWFHYTKQMSRKNRKLIEKKLIDFLSPPWNGRDVKISNEK
jgi:hypothetical protein